MAYQTLWSQRLSTSQIPTPPSSIFPTPSDQSHSWVRLNRGIYKGDITFIRSVDVYSTILINVLVVPRVTYEIRQMTSSQHSTSPIASLTEELQHQGSLPKPCSIQLWQSKGFVRHSKSETPYLYSEECSTMSMDMHFSRISTLTGIRQKMWYQTRRNLNVLAPAQIFLSASNSTQWRECRPGSFG